MTIHNLDDYRTPEPTKTTAQLIEELLEALADW
jgi:hypothetical protein